MRPPHSRWWALTVVVVVGYVGGMQAAARALDSAWSTVPLFEASRPDGLYLRMVVQPITWLCGSLLFTFVPGWPWAALLRRRDHALPADRLLPFLCAAFAISIAAQIGAGTMVKWLWGPLDRLSYTVLLLAIVATGWAIVMLRHRPSAMPGLTAGDVRACGAALAGVAILVVAFWGKIIHEDFNGDGIEAFELARSLVQYPLPWWDIETTAGGHFSYHLTHPPLLAFLHLPALLLFGFTEASVRGLFVFAWLLTIPLAWVVIETGSTYPRASIRWLAALGLLPLVLNALFYSGTDDFSELAKCGEIVLLALAVAAVALLQRRHLTLGVIFAVMASGIRWYGPVVMVTGVGLFAMSDRRYRRPLVGLLIALGVTGACALTLSAAAGHLPTWLAQFRYEFRGIIGGVAAYRAAPLSFAFHFLLFSGFLAPVVVLVRWQDPTTRVLSWLCILVLMFVSRSSLMANHYLAVAAYLPALVLCRMLAQRPVGRGVRIAWALGVGAVLAAGVGLLPTRIPVHNATSLIGRQTCLDASSYERAVALSSVAGSIAADAGFLIGPHALAHYGRWVSSPAPDCTYYISANPRWAPPTATQVVQTGISTLWADPGRRKGILAMEVPPKNAYYRIPFLRAVITGR